MTEDETISERKDELPFGRAYDYFKHLTGISLVSIGGVFAFMDGTGATFDPRRVIIVLAAIGVAGVISLLMAGALVTIEVKTIVYAKLARQVRYGLISATFFLAIGLGSFIQTFASAILK
ncbi:hypothetical protein Q9Q95_17815 [Sphingomonas sp. DG1-23]|uniref:hypothetical protein n=1 Tax=Sphingomonas sp. DG1-23 TaxID=3068316 RepID=UPI00273F5253|nr:hypothetical protein [Sphingomonas sp. DG1-23]MDP5280787.1 hypothetical protein [Sphingomonas sp. DG1-23]